MVLIIIMVFVITMNHVTHPALFVGITFLLKFG